MWTGNLLNALGLCLGLFVDTLERLPHRAAVAHGSRRSRDAAWQRLASYGVVTDTLRRQMARAIAAVHIEANAQTGRAWGHDVCRTHIAA